MGKICTYSVRQLELLIRTGAVDLRADCPDTWCGWGGGSHDDSNRARL